MGVQDRDWYWEHREAVKRSRFWPKAFRADRSSVRPAAVSAGSVPKAWLIAVGVLAGLLLASVVPQIKGHFAQQRAAQQAADALARGRLEEAREADAAAVREDARRHAIAEQEDRRAAAASARAESQLRQDAERRAETLRRERAWSKFYVRSERCKVNTDVECANEFIRAKRAFEAGWPANVP